MFSFVQTPFKVARNEVKNASFGQRPAHREGKNMVTGIDRTGRWGSNRPTPTHRFCHSAIFHPITPYNVWFFWVRRHRSIILAKKPETFWGNSEKLRNSRKCAKSWIIENVSWSHKRLGFLSSSLWKIFLKLTKSSSLSAPTKIEELTAGSDKKKTQCAAPPGIKPRVLRIPVARSNH